MRRSRLRLALVLLLAWIVVPVTLTEALLRLYERRVLTAHGGPGLGSAPVIDLARLGYANGPVTVAKAAGEVRVLSFGDSFAYGIVRDEHNYNRVIERDLSAATGRAVSVVNLGRPSTSFPDYQLEIDFWTRVLPHDAIVVNVYAGNDFVDLASASFGPPRADFGASLARAFRTGVEVPRKFPLRTADYAYALALSWTVRGAGGPEYRGASRIPPARYLRIMTAAAQVYRRHGPGPDWRGLGTSYAYLAELLRRLEAARTGGTDVLVVVSPPHLVLSDRVFRDVNARGGLDADGYDLGRPGKIVRAAARVAGYQGAVFDLYPCLREHADRGVTIHFESDTHWSVEGNRVVGHFVTDLMGEAWPRVRAGRRFSECAIGRAVPPPDEEVSAFLARTVPKILTARLGPLDADGLRAVVVRAATRRYGDRAEAEAVLGGLGLRPSPDVVGVLDDVRAGAPDRARGWALDRAGRSWPVEVLLFLDGAVVASGAPDAPRPDVSQSLRLGADDRTRPGFSLAAPGLCPASAAGDRLWLLAVSRSRTFAWLPAGGGAACR